MNSKWNLITAIFQLVVGIMAIISFFIILISEEEIGRWIITLILAVSFIILGVIGIIDYFKNKKG